MNNNLKILATIMCNIVRLVADNSDNHLVTIILKNTFFFFINLKYNRIFIKEFSIRMARLFAQWPKNESNIWASESSQPAKNMQSKEKWLF